jgi:hypothetical protein
MMRVLLVVLAGLAWGGVAGANPPRPEAEQERDLGLKRLKEGNVIVAMVHFEEAVRLDPNWACAYTARGLGHNAQRKYQAAITDFNKAIAINPVCADCLAQAFEGRASAYEGLGDRERARRDRDFASVARTQQPGEPRVAGSRDPDAPVPPRTGTVRLVNAYTQAMLIRVNGRNYQLDPGQTLDVALAPGSFTYEVVGVRGAVSRPLEPGQTYTVRVHP